MPLTLPWSSGCPLEFNNLFGFSRFICIAIPAIYCVMGIATWYFAIEAIVLERGMWIAAFLAVASIALIAYGIHIRHLRGKSKTTGTS